MKREFPYHRWEPIYICTKQEPFYDERLSWEGLQDKMTQVSISHNSLFHIRYNQLLFPIYGIKISQSYNVLYLIPYYKALLPHPLDA